jgi:hypothetical protein
MFRRPVSISSSNFTHKLLIFSNSEMRVSNTRGPTSPILLC